MAAASLAATTCAAASWAAKKLDDGIVNKNGVAHSLSSSFAFGRPLAEMVAAPRHAVRVGSSSRRRQGVIVRTRAMAKELYFNKDGSATKKMQVLFSNFSLPLSVSVSVSVSLSLSLPSLLLRFEIK
jgi:hypothetical protein